MTDYTKLDAYPRTRAASGKFVVVGLEKLFGYYVEKPETAGACWIWRGMRNEDGYGQVRFRGKMRGAHRVAWTLEKGEIPSGLLVCHRCDNPPCVRVDHLFLGTVADNNRDRANKGRGKGFVSSADHPAKRRAGERHWCAKINDEQVSQIRQRVANGETQTRVAADFKIHSATVSRIVRNEWRKEPV